MTITVEPSHPNFFYGEDPISQEFLASKYDANANKEQAAIDQNRRDMQCREVAVSRFDQQIAEYRAQGFDDSDPEIQSLTLNRQSVSNALAYLRDILHPALLRNLQVHQSLAADARNRARKARIRAGLKVPDLATPPQPVDHDRAVIARNF